MTLDTARSTITSYVHTAWATQYPTIPDFYMNGPNPDLDALSKFMTCAVSFNGSDQTNIDPSPMLRIRGRVYLCIWVKERTGQSVTLGYQGFLISLLKFKNLSHIQLGTPAPRDPYMHQGWLKTETEVPFHFDM